MKAQIRTQDKRDLHNVWQRWTCILPFPSRVKSVHKPQMEGSRPALQFNHLPSRWSSEVFLQFPERSCTCCGMCLKTCQGCNIRRCNRCLQFLFLILVIALVSFNTRARILTALLWRCCSDNQPPACVQVPDSLLFLLQGPRGLLGPKGPTGPVGSPVSIAWN